MKGTELRIGNLIYGESKRVESVSAIISKDYIETVGFLGVKISNVLAYDCQPIPITKQCLVNFGFEITNYDIACIENKMYLHFGACHWEYRHPFHPIKVIHVHQLQNLYYALTGQELTLK